MLISSERCTGCGECLKDCYRKAIGRGVDDKVAIDPALCDECRDLFEPRCPRNCEYDAIGHLGQDGIFEPVIADSTARYRPQNLVYLIVAMHPQGFDFYTEMPWPAILNLLSRFAANPQMQACISTHLDDFCKGCEAKYSAKHREGNGEQDKRVYAALEIEPWDVLPIRELLRRMVREYPVDKLREEMPLKECEYEWYDQMRPYWLAAQ